MEKRKIEILYADDTASMRDFTKIAIPMLFNKDSYEVSVDVVNSGEELIQRVEEYPSRYRGLISDFEMGEVSGLEALTRLREKFPGLKSFIVTGNNEKANEARARGFDALDKPYTSSQLREQLVKTFPEFYQPIAETA